MNRRCLHDSLISGLATASLVLAPACGKRDDPESSASPAGGSSAAADGPKDEVASGAGRLPPMTEAPVHYAAALEPLLDLVPEKTGHFVLVRDALALLRLFDNAFGTAPALLPKLVPGILDDSTGAIEVIEGVTKLRDAFVAAKVDLARGVVFLEEQEVVVYATSSGDPSALKIALKAAGLDAQDIPPKCEAIPKMPGFMGCAKEGTNIATLEAGNHGAALMAEFETALPGFDVERGNVLMRLNVDDKVLWGAVATPLGQAHLVLGLAEVAAEVENYFQSGPTPALALLDPRGGFVWGRFDMDAFEPELAEAPAPVATVAGTLTGEIFLGGLREQGGVALLAGVRDPYPASGLVSLASLQLDALRSGLPPDAKLEVQPVSLGEADTPTLQLGFTPDGESVKAITAMGLKPNAYGFSVGEYAGGVFGTDEQAVKALAGFKGSPEPQALVGVPAGLAGSLQRQEVALAMHLSFDALQSPKIRAVLEEAMAAAIEGQAPALLDLDVPAVVLGLLSPLSSISWWVTHPKDARVLHTSLQMFTDLETDEGKAARDALVRVIDGGDPSTAYAALATRFAGSARAPLYRVRAGGDVDGVGTAAMTTSFLFGALAGVAIPAFTQYAARSKAAAQVP